MGSTGQRYSDKSRHLEEGKEVARPRSLFPFVLQQALHSVSDMISADREWRSRTPSSSSARPDPCTSALCPGENQGQGTGRSKRGRGR